MVPYRGLVMLLTLILMLALLSKVAWRVEGGRVGQQGAYGVKLAVYYRHVSKANRATHVGSALSHNRTASACRPSCTNHAAQRALYMLR